jgi:hypothetical protein
MAPSQEVVADVAALLRAQPPVVNRYPRDGPALELGLARLGTRVLLGPDGTARCAIARHICTDLHKSRGWKENGNDSSGGGSHMLLSRTV